MSSDLTMDQRDRMGVVAQRLANCHDIVKGIRAEMNDAGASDGGMLDAQLAISEAAIAVSKTL